MFVPHILPSIFMILRLSFTKNNQSLTITTYYVSRKCVPSTIDNPCYLGMTNDEITNVIFKICPDGSEF